MGRSEEDDWKIPSATPEATDEEALDGDWELDPNDPSHLDHDLSIAAGYSNWEPSATPWFAKPNVVLAITAIIVIGLVLVPILYLI